MIKNIGIDLGTANTLLYVSGKGIAMFEPSVVALEKRTGNIVAVGARAKRMLGKTPGSIVTFRPLKDGVIADFEITVRMLHEFFVRIGATSFFNKPNVIVSIPYGVTEVEKLAVENAAFEAGARNVCLVEEPIAAAIGAKLRVSGNRGCMIIDIGGGTTEVAVISMDGIVASRSLRIAGDEMDNAIVQYMKTVHGILIGEITAEQLKNRIGSVHSSADRGSMRVYGRNLRDNSATEVEVFSGEMRQAMRTPIEQIVAAIKGTLEDTPPELAADIYEYGITVAGGGALLGGIAEVISARTGLKVSLAQRPLEAVCRGIARVIESDGRMENVIRYRSR
ncbi:MAG: rod shape-determining protein [Clostridia bacterium]|nr:rod shape-determining protein [Clostridia bacterium]